MLKKWGWILQQLGKQPLTYGDAAWLTVAYAVGHFSGSAVGGVLVAVVCGTTIRLLARRAEKEIPELRDAS